MVRYCTSVLSVAHLLPAQVEVWLSLKCFWNGKLCWVRPAISHIVHLVSRHDGWSTDVNWWQTVSLFSCKQFLFLHLYHLVVTQFLGNLFWSLVCNDWCCWFNQVWRTRSAWPSSALFLTSALVWIWLVAWVLTRPISSTMTTSELALLILSRPLLHPLPYHRLVVADAGYFPLLCIPDVIWTSRDVFGLRQFGLHVYNQEYFLLRRLCLA